MNEIDPHRTTLDSSEPAAAERRCSECGRAMGSLIARLTTRIADCRQSRHPTVLEPEVQPQDLGHELDLPPPPGHDMAKSKVAVSATGRARRQRSAEVANIHIVPVDKAIRTAKARAASGYEEPEGLSTSDTPRKPRRSKAQSQYTEQEIQAIKKRHQRDDMTIEILENFSRSTGVKITVTQGAAE